MTSLFVDIYEGDLISYVHRWVLVGTERGRLIYNSSFTFEIYMVYSNRKPRFILALNNKTFTHTSFVCDFKKMVVHQFCCEYLTALPSPLCAR
tara:strand:+ start:850 stop:1128 length:279 start_codon:yes stop_codon:yes gene_type:complete